RARAAGGRAVGPGAAGRNGGGGPCARAGEAGCGGAHRPRGHLRRGQRRSRRRPRPLDRSREGGGRRLRARPDAGAAPRARGGRLPDRVPPPPEPPGVPPALEELASADPDAVAARLVAPDGAAPTLPPVAASAPPALPAFDLPSLPEPPAGRLPGPLALEET